MSHRFHPDKNSVLRRPHHCKRQAAICRIISGPKGQLVMPSIEKGQIAGKKSNR